MLAGAGLPLSTQQPHDAGIPSLLADPRRRAHAFELESQRFIGAQGRLVEHVDVSSSRSMPGVLNASWIISAVNGRASPWRAWRRDGDAAQARVAVMPFISELRMSDRRAIAANHPAAARGRRAPAFRQHGFHVQRRERIESCEPPHWTTSARLENQPARRMVFCRERAQGQHGGAYAPVTPRGMRGPAPQYRRAPAAPFSRFEAQAQHAQVAVGDLEIAARRHVQEAGIRASDDMLAGAQAGALFTQEVRQPVQTGLGPAVGWMPACCSASWPSTDSVMVMLAGASSADAMRGPSTRPWLNMWSASSSAGWRARAARSGTSSASRAPPTAASISASLGLFARGQVARQFEGDLGSTRTTAPCEGTGEAALKWTVDV